MARPKKRVDGDEQSDFTRLVRVNADLADMIAWIVRIQGGTAAQLLDPLLRPFVHAKFEQIKPMVEQIAKIEQLAKDEINQLKDKNQKVD